MSDQADELRRIYETRFEKNLNYRRAVWEVLVGDLFQQYIPEGGTVLDLGCGYGEFINTVKCGRKLAMDLNPDAKVRLDANVELLAQDCSAPWGCGENSLDVVFTSNFFEHLPDKAALSRTLNEARRCLKPGGKLIAMGPNIRYLPGQYWDFWDHHLALSELSLCEGLVNHGFKIAESYGRFLPYTMVNSREYPIFFLRCYLRLKLAWPLLGRQFLVIAAKA